MFRPTSALLVLAAVLFGSTIGVNGDSPISPEFPYGKEKVRGVNLGGWFVLHPWMQPSLFDDTNNSAIIDEWTFCQLQNRTTAEAALQNHWATFYTEADFEAIAAAGLNHVRIQIGYWAFEVGPGEPYIQGQLPYLWKSFEWAKKHGLKLIIDLYGAPGSQNGFIESGHILPFPGWHSNATNVARTRAVVRTIAEMFHEHTDVVPIIAPLDKPAGFDGADVLSVAQQYFQDAYEILRFPSNSSEQSNTVVLIHDAFQDISFWDGFMTPPSFQGVAIDTRIYQGFNVTDLVLTPEGHIAKACAQASSLGSFDLWRIIGEWTLATTDCAAWINGRSTGSVYDGTFNNTTPFGSCSGVSGFASTFNSTYKAFLRQFWEAQTSSYEAGAGWIFWTWKTTPGAGEEWSYTVGLEEGWIPQDPTERLYPDICG